MAVTANWFKVLPRSDKITGIITGRNYVSAIFQQERMANDFAQKYWPATAEVVKGSIPVPKDRN